MAGEDGRMPYGVQQALLPLLEGASAEGGGGHGQHWTRPLQGKRWRVTGGPGLCWDNRWIMRQPLWIVTQSWCLVSDWSVNPSAAAPVVAAA